MMIIKIKTRNSLIENLTISLHIQSLLTCLIQKIFDMGMEESREGTLEILPASVVTKFRNTFPLETYTGLQYTCPIDWTPRKQALKFKASCGHEVLLHKSLEAGWGSVSRECARIDSRHRICGMLPLTEIDAKCTQIYKNDRLVI